MTVLRDFIEEIASELDARTDKPLAPQRWISFVKLLAAIDRALVGTGVSSMTTLNATIKPFDVKLAGSHRRPILFAAGDRPSQ